MKFLLYTGQITFGGAERVLCVLANSLVAKGHNVRFFFGDKHVLPYQIEPAVEVSFHHNPIRYNNPISLIKEISAIHTQVKTYKPDVVITFFSQWAVFAHFAILFNKRVKLIYSQRNDPLQDKGRNKIMDTLATKWADCVVFQSKAVKELYGKGIQRRSVIITNPFNPEKLPEYDIGRTQDIIISAGRLANQKNHRLLIESFALLRRDLPGLKLKIFGEGHLRETLQKQIESLGLHDDVLLPGNSSSLWEEMSNSRLFVLSSDYEGVPNILIEAMCMGMPCISTDFSPKGAVGELLVNGENGLVVETGNPKIMAMAMKKLLMDVEESKRLGNNARKLIHKVDSAVVMDQWEHLCSNLINR